MLSQKAAIYLEVLSIAKQLQSDHKQKLYHLLISPCSMRHVVVALPLRVVMKKLG